MTDQTTITDAQYAELVARIEELAPTAGFWVKGKSLDFTLEDILLAVQDHSLLLNVYGDFIMDDGINARWHLSKPLSSQSNNLKLFLHSLLCS